MTFEYRPSASAGGFFWCAEPWYPSSKTLLSCFEIIANGNTRPVGLSFAVPIVKLRASGREEVKWLLL